MLQRAQRFDPRQNMHSNRFEIFHYRDYHLSPVAMHHHDFYEIYFFLSGQVEYRVEGSTFLLHPGDLLLISPMELHQPIFRSGTGPYERIVLWIGKEYLESLSTDQISLTRCFDHTRPSHANLLRLDQSRQTAITAKMMELVDEAYSDRYGRDIHTTGMLLQLLVELNRISLQAGEHSADAPILHRPPHLIAQVLSYVGEHYCESISLDALAERFYVSKYHLSHEFQQSVGTSLYRYIILKRLLNAKQMLSSGIAPGTVCHSCGFGDYANFYRAFKAEYGISPRAYAAGESV